MTWVLQILLINLKVKCVFPGFFNRILAFACVFTVLNQTAVINLHAFVAVICQLVYRNATCVHHFQPKPIDTQVITHHMQRYAVWFGGSMLASTVCKI